MGKTTKKRRPVKKTKRKKRKKKQFSYKKNICQSDNCLHEKCHHLKVVKYLKKLKRTRGINFFPSLLPYNKIPQAMYYGVIKGMPDFCIVHPFVENKKIVRNALYIELKTARGTLTAAEKIEIKSIVKKRQALVGVTFGVKATKKLINGYLTKKKLSDVEKLCWAGPVKKHHVAGVRSSSIIVLD
jgi:hypothetical protein